MKGKTTLSQPATVQVLTGNDDFRNSPTIIGSNVQVLASNELATNQPNEPAHGSGTPAHSVWWNWRAPRSGPVLVETAGSDFRTALQVYTGGSLASLIPVGGGAGRLDSDHASVGFFATSNATYHIAVDSFDQQTGTILLSLVQPPTGLVISGRLLPTGGFELRVAGSPGKYLIEASSDLVVWNGVSLVTLTTEPARYLDLTFGQFERRFYRAIKSP
jgi:hypothetical protein